MSQKVKTQVNKVKEILRKLQTQIDQIPKYKFDSKRAYRLSTVKKTIEFYESQINRVGIEPNEEEFAHFQNKKNWFDSNRVQEVMNHNFNTDNDYCNTNKKDEIKKDKDPNYLTSIDISISTDKLDRVLKILEETEVIELIGIFENLNSNCSETNLTRSPQDKIKRNVANNLFIYELFIMKYYTHLLNFKKKLDALDYKFYLKAQLKVKQCENNTQNSSEYLNQSLESIYESFM